MNTTDKLTIDTPEQIALELPLAGIGSRFLALAFDTLLQFILGFVGFLLLAWIGSRIGPLTQTKSTPSHVSENVAVAIVILFFFCLYWGYFAFFEIIWKGQTPGKRHAGIRVIKESGRPINAFEAVGRNLLRAVDGLPGMYAVGIVTMFLNVQNKRLGDYVAGTVVVHDKQLQDFRPDFATTTTEQPQETRSEVAQIGADELVLIETYLQRRFELDPMVRLNTADSIVKMVKAKTGVGPEQGQMDDDFLENVAKQVRDGARFR